MFWHKTPKIIQNSFPGFHWKVPNSTSVYLTFDDGPVRGVTDWVLNLLKHEEVPATFFCVGDNIRKHPDVFQSLIEHGHKSGNHTYHHLDGWRSKSRSYLEDIDMCQSLLPDTTRMFRPPYGRVNRKSIKRLKQTHEVVMWDVLIGDFLPDLQPELVTRKCLDLLQEGSIILFHDSLKSERKMKEILPRFIEGARTKGFDFKQLPW